ncbi:MAG: peptide-methionine (S)-S-oxide reductase MsrA [Spirosomaceae bacterium]|nr:peptide-methionine (S)-S-oxide reductase MsrA [Spirosomataceae bacterium]
MKTLLSSILLIGVISCANKSTSGSNDVKEISVSEVVNADGQATAAFAEGCFWCVEEVFEAVAGVDSAISGYAGGHTKNPTYALVNTETTGHAETVLVYYNPEIVSYKELVRVFYLSHDPTTPNQQGPDRGSSYRSILFYQTPAEKAIAEDVTAAMKTKFKAPIVTEIKKLDTFYRAEQYHQDYVEHNPGNPYVQNVSKPRFERFKRSYDGKLK